MIMDGRHLDQMAKSLAAGVSRRATLKTIVGALGLTAAGTLEGPRTTVAQCAYSGCTFINDSTGRFRYRCLADSCPGSSKKWRFVDGECFSTREECQTALNS
jgi:hypothetical protein